MTAVIAAVLAACAAWLLTRPRVRRRHGTVRWQAIVSAAQRRLASRRQRAGRRAATRDALAEVVADLRAGQPIARAAERALGGGLDQVAPRAVAAIRWGGDVVSALRDDSRSSGRALLAGAAACWSVAEASGAGLAEALDRLVQQDRRAEEVRRQLEAHLAAPRATARMLACLPLLGVALGFAIGGDPLSWLLGTPLGLGCLLVGGALTVIGMLWAGRIAARTERLL